MGRIQFTARNGTTLQGSLELPPGGHWRATAVFAHCFTCSSQSRAARTISRSLARAGYAVLRFDFTGLGESEGDFADTTFTSNLDDLEDAAAWLGQQYEAPQVLLGHSLGGTAVLAMAGRLDSVRAVATLAAPSSPRHVLRQFEEKLDAIRQEGSAEVELAGRVFRIRRDFVEDVNEQDLPGRVGGLRRALLVMHSPTDRVVNISNAEAIYRAARHPKSFVSLDDADHLLTRRADAEYAATVIAAWAGRFLAEETAAAADGVRVSGRTEDGFLCRVQAGSHGLVADEPREAGGGDQGPDPYALLASALGTCTVMTINMYARHKKLALERVSCDVSHRKVHAEDCEGCEAGNDKVDELSRTLYFEGELSDEQRERLLEIADRCPVHRTLHGDIRVVTSLSGSGSRNGHMV
ncbi:MAG: bifunctional alpha/beta hydrolase/OsmC family protein [Pseudohongiellaceae bacterium]